MDPDSSKLSCDNLGIDKACIILKSSMEVAVSFLYRSLECEKCSFTELATVRPNHTKKILLDFASLGSDWEVVNSKNNDTLCRSKETHLGENSGYNLYVNATGDCSFVCEKQPENIYIPIFVAIAVYISLALIWMIAKYLHRKEVFNRVLRRNSLDELAAAYSSSSTIDDNKQKQSRQRLRSLDTVRGIAIVIMIFVNYGGGKYWFFHHAHWNGLTFADLVFPWFIWMMGMSMALSIRSQLRKAISRRKIFFKIVKRSVILFCLGIMLNTICTDVDLQQLRILGVLQRFGLSYFVVATTHLFYASTEDYHMEGRLAIFRDILLYWGEWVIMLAILCLHLCLTFLLSAPGCPKGYLGPGGLHDDGNYSFCIGGAAGYIDRVVLGVGHLYQRPSSNAFYHSALPYDPEGILGTLTSIFLVFLGLQAGKILLIYKEWKPRVIRWLAWGCFMGVLAALLCEGSKHDGWIPVNKNLWSVSFIMATGGLAFILISVCYLVIDIKKWWSGAPFCYAGMNSIMLYVGHEMTQNMFPWRWQVKPNHMDELFLNLWGTTIWVVISMWMHHKDIFIVI